MLFLDSNIKNLHACKELAIIINEFYTEDFLGNFDSRSNFIKYKEIKGIFYSIADLIVRLDDFLFLHNYVSVEFIHKFESNFANLVPSSDDNNKIFHNFLDRFDRFLEGIIVFVQSFNEVKEYNFDFEDEIKLILSKINEYKNNQIKEGANKKIQEVSGENNLRLRKVNTKIAITPNSVESSIRKIKEYEKFISNHKEEFLDEKKEILGKYTKDLTDSFNELKIKSQDILQEYNNEVNASKLKFKNQVDDEISSFKEKIEEVNKDFKNSVKDFEVLKKFINAKGEQEITDHYKNKAKWERVTYWLMTFVTFGIIIFSVCMAINGLDEYKEKANISVETLLEKYKEQPVEKIEKIYGAVQSSALTYLVLRLIFSVLLFSSIIYTSRVAYRAYVHMRHSENMMLKLATLRPFINQLDESERNQIHKDLVPDYFGKDAGLVDGASEKFKDLPANVSAVAMKAIEQIGGSTGTSNSKSPDPKDAKTAGE